MHKLFILISFFAVSLAVISSAAPVEFLSPFSVTPQASKNNESVSSLPEGLTTRRTLSGPATRSPATGAACAIN